MAKNKLPPRGSFSTVVTSGSFSSRGDDERSGSGAKPGDGWNWDKGRDIGEICEVAQEALREVTEVQEDITRLLDGWGLGVESEVDGLRETNQLLVENGYEPITNLLSPGPILRLVRHLLIHLKHQRKSLKSSIENSCKLEEALKSCQSHLSSFKSENKHVNSNPSPPPPPAHELLSKSSQASPSPSPSPSLSPIPKSHLNSSPNLKSKFSSSPNLKSPIRPSRLPSRQSKHVLPSDSELILNTMSVLSCSNREEIPSKLNSVKIVLSLAPKLEKFVQQICKEFVPELDYDSGSEIYATALKEVFDRINAVKIVIDELVRFKVNVCESFGVDEREGQGESLMDSLQIVKDWRTRSFKGSLRFEEVWQKNEKLIEEVKDVAEKMLDGFAGFFNDFTLRERIRGILKEIKLMY